MFLGMGTTALLPVGLAVKRFADFDDVMREVRAVSQATEEGFAKLTDTAKRLGATTSFTALEVGALMAELGRAGFNPDQINEMTAAVLNLSRATKTEAALSAGIMAAAIRQFNLDASDSTRVADGFTTAANKTFNTVEQLAEAMSYAGPVADDFGMSFEDTLAILGGLGNVGIQGSNAGTAIRRLLTITGAEAEKLKGIFGVSFIDAAGNARPLVDTLGEVAAATADLGTAERAAKFNEAFGLLGITAAGVIGRAAGDIKGLAGDIKDATGVAATSAAAMDAGIGGAFRILLSAAEGVAIAIGESLNGEIKALAEWLTKAAERMRDFIGQNRQLIVAAVKVAAGVTAFGAALLFVGTASIATSTAIGGVTAAVGVLTGVVGIGATALRSFGAVATMMSGAVTKAIQVAVGTWTLQLGGFATASAFFGTLAGGIAAAIGSILNPIGLAIAGAVAVITALGFAFWKLADPITALMPLASAIGTAFKGIAGALLSGDFAGAFEVLASSIRTVMFAAARGVIDIFRNMLTNLVGLITGTSGGIVGTLSTISNAAKRIFGEVWEAGKVALGALSLFATDVFMQAPQIIGYAFGLAIETVAMGVMKLQDWLGQVFVGFVTTLYNSFAGMGPGLIRAMLTGDIAGAVAAIGPAVQKALAAQTLAASGLAAGLFGGEMPEFKMSPETIAAYEKMATVLAPSAATPADPVAEPPKPPTPPVTPDIDTDVDKIIAKTREELNLIATPLEKYNTRIKDLSEALAAETITQKEFNSAAADARDEIFGLQSSPLEEFRDRVQELQQAFQSKAIGPKEYGEQLAIAKREILGIEPEKLTQFGDRVKDLREQLTAGAIDKTEFDAAFKQSQQDFLGTSTDPIDAFKQKIVELRKALDAGLITKDQFKAGALEALPDRVKQIVDETRTPLEKYKKDMAELEKLKQAGLIDPETYKRKAEQLRVARDGESSTKPTVFGSFSASALADAGRGTGSQGPQERMTKIMEENKALTKDQVAELKELRKLLDRVASGLVVG
jgi:TP901 family phage tail tape measure protein